MEKPAPPPEAVLIRLVREASGISVADAAKAAGISKARWSQVESGSETRLGRYRPVTGSRMLIAHMAAAVGADPERLAATGPRGAEAAQVLAEIVRQREAGQHHLAEDGRPLYADPEDQRVADDAWEAAARLEPEVRRGTVALAVQLHRKRRGDVREYRRLA